MPRLEPLAVHLRTDEHRNLRAHVVADLQQIDARRRIPPRLKTANLGDPVEQVLGERGVESEIAEQLLHSPHLPGDFEDRPFHEADDEQIAVVKLPHLAVEVLVPLGRRHIGEGVSL